MLNSPVDIAIVFGVALLIFGPKKLPELGKALGQGIGNFKRSLQEAQDEVKNAVSTDKEERPADDAQLSADPPTVAGVSHSKSDKPPANRLL
jgi:sec-independent protein translocase protein TatA